MPLGNLILSRSLRFVGSKSVLAVTFFARRISIFITAVHPFELDSKEPCWFVWVANHNRHFWNTSSYTLSL